MRRRRMLGLCPARRKRNTRRRLRQEDSMAFDVRPLRFAAAIAATLSLALSFATVAAAQPAPSGKQLTIIVGTPVGGGYDAYARLVGRHFGRFLPGNPTIVVQNMPGAG